MNTRSPLRSLMAGVVLVLAMVGLPAYAGGGSENVLLVVNTDSFSSMTLANEFIRLRQVPPCNVLYLSLGDLRDQSAVDINTFRQRILGPVLETINERGLQPQIDYVTYSSDIPYAVDVNPELRDAKGQPIKVGMTITPVAATTGLTYLYRPVMDKAYIKYLNLGVNRYARQPLKVNVDVSKLQRYLDAARQRIENKEFDQAQDLVSQLLKALPANPEILYVNACLLAGQGKPDDAIASLKQAVERGFNKAGRAESDAQLATLRTREDFKALLKQMNDTKLSPAGMDESLQTQPTVAFRSVLGWDDKGNPTMEAGERYMLSTMLAWTAGRGISVRQALDNLRRGVAVDGTSPKGTFYFMLNSDVRSTTRKWGFAAAAARLREMGHQAEIVEGTLPKDRKDVMGLMAGSSDFDFAASGCEIKPGAIAEHLTSFGGVLYEPAGQTPCTEFSRFGAAGTSGTVTEPYALQAKFPLPFIHVHYARGCSLAESFYQSVQGPYQLIVLGDPLCQPWASIPEVTVGGVKNGDRVKGTIELTPGTTTDAKIAQWLLFVDGKRTSTCAPGSKLTLDTTALADGLHDLRVVGVREGAIMTQGRRVLNVTVANGNVKGTAKLKQDKLVFGQSTTLTASAEGASKIEVYANGRLIGTAQKGELTIDSRQLGVGTVTLQAVAVMGDKPTQHVNLPTAALTIEEPAPIAAVDVATGKRLDVEAFNSRKLPVPTTSSAASLGSFAVTVDKVTKPVTTSLRDGRWLSAAGAVAGKPFTVQGYVKASEDDLHQLLVFFDGELSVEIDGQPLAAQQSAKGWHHFPANLKAGWHELKITGTSKGAPSMEVRLGVRGTPLLTGDRVMRLK